MISSDRADEFNSLKQKLGKLFSGEMDAAELKTLLAAKEAENFPQLGAYLLRRAVEERAYAAIPKILTCGININSILDTKSFKQQTALSLASHRGDAAMVEILLQAGADVNLCAPLEAAACGFHPKCVALLLRSVPNLGNAFNKAITIGRMNEGIIVDHYINTMDDRLRVIKEFLRPEVLRDYPEININEAAAAVIDSMFFYDRTVNLRSKLSFADSFRYKILVLLLRRGALAEFFMIPIAAKNLLVLLNEAYRYVPQERKFAVMENIIRNDRLSSCLIQMFLAQQLEHLPVTIDLRTLDLRFYIYSEYLREQLTDYLYEFSENLKMQKINPADIFNSVLKRKNHTPQVVRNIYLLCLDLELDLTFKNARGENFLHHLGKICAGYLNSLKTDLEASNGLTRGENFADLLILMARLAGRGVNPFEPDIDRKRPIDYIRDYARKDPARIARIEHRIESAYENYLVERRFMSEVMLLAQLHMFKHDSEFSALFKALPKELLLNICEHLGKSVKHRKPPAITKKIYGIFLTCERIGLNKQNFCLEQPAKNSAKAQADDQSITINQARSPQP